MSAGDLAACLLAAAAATEASRDELGRLDSVAGDGDHGLTMTLGARAVRKAIERNPGATTAELLDLVADAMGSVGGAIGPIYDKALEKIAAIAQGRDGSAGPATVSEVRACAEAAAATIATVGHARRGDKTILDALMPAAESLLASERDGVALEAALARASEAARAGAENTAGMIASIGRAARLGEQSRGTADAGATSFAIIVAAAVAEFVSRQGSELVGAQG